MVMKSMRSLSNQSCGNPRMVVVARSGRNQHNNAQHSTALHLPSPSHVKRRASRHHRVTVTNAYLSISMYVRRARARRLWPMSRRGKREGRSERGSERHTAGVRCTA